MALKHLSESEKEALLIRLVSKTQNMEEAQGADFNLFRGFEAWAILRSLTASEAKVQGILGNSLLYGNGHILILSLGKLLDTDRKQKSSLKKLWTDFSDAVPGSNEKQLITSGLKNPKVSDRLKYVCTLRHEIFAHNKKTRLSIDNEPIEQALHFCFRAWHLLSELIPENFMLFPFKHFSNENWKLRSIFSPQEYNRFERAWSACYTKR